MRTGSYVTWGDPERRDAAADALVALGGDVVPALLRELTKEGREAWRGDGCCATAPPARAGTDAVPANAGCGCAAGCAGPCCAPGKDG